MRIGILSSRHMFLGVSVTGVLMYFGTGPFVSTSSLPEEVQQASFASAVRLQQVAMITPSTPQQIGSTESPKGEEWIPRDELVGQKYQCLFPYRHSIPGYDNPDIVTFSAYFNGGSYPILDTDTDKGYVRTVSDVQENGQLRVVYFQTGDLTSRAGNSPAFKSGGLGNVQPPLPSICNNLPVDDYGTMPYSDQPAPTLNPP